MGVDHFTAGGNSPHWEVMYGTSFQKAWGFAEYKLERRPLANPRPNHVGYFERRRIFRKGRLLDVDPLDLEFAYVFTYAPYIAWVTATVNWILYEYRIHTGLSCSTYVLFTIFQCLDEIL